MSGSPQELARACSRWSRYGCPASGLMSEGQGNFRAVYARVATSRLSDGERGQSERRSCIQCSQGLATACSGCSGLGQHQSAEECIPAPSQVGSLQGASVMGLEKLECNGVLVGRSLFYPFSMPTWASCRAREGGYSAVRVLRYTPCSFTPAMPPGPVFSNCCSRTPTTWRRLCCACRRLPTPGHTGDHVAFGSWPLPADGGCSQMPTPPLETTALNRAPSMYCGVLKALGLPGRSLSLEYSLQGGASMIRATIPDQQSLRRASKTSLSRMSCAVSPSRSKGSKQSRPRPMAADVTACSLPANTSKKSRFEAGCNG